MKTNTKATTQAKKKKNGFTLIEVIAVLVLLGILAAVAVPAYVDMSDAAKDRAIDAAVSELNGREALTWGDNSLAATGWSADEVASTALGDDYSYTAGGTPETGGSLTFQSGTAVSLTRVPATATSPATWSR